MPIDLSIEIFGQEQVKRTIMRPSEHASDARPAFHVILELFREEERLRFRAEGPGWEPLKESTLRSKAAKGLRLGILMGTGELYESLTSPSSPSAIADVDRTGMRFGTRRPHAASHQFGAIIENAFGHEGETVRIPQRTLIDFGEPTKRTVVKILQGWVLTGKVDTIG